MTYRITIIIYFINPFSVLSTRNAARRNISRCDDDREPGGKKLYFKITLETEKRLIGFEFDSMMKEKKKKLECYAAVGNAQRALVFHLDQSAETG